jgi:ribosomal RNA assembly protein
MEEYSYELKIPKDRIAVLIGKNGKVKKELEEQTDLKIEVDSKEGDVTITGKDSLKLYSVREMVKAIGRGFNPEIAQLLLKQDYFLEIINLADFAKNKNQMPRLKGRIIGAEGKARDNLEKLTETRISVYGKTVSILGSNEGVLLAKKAIESLLEGCTHATVYKMLERKRREMKRREATEI